jgi:hypothetical protein
MCSCKLSNVAEVKHLSGYKEQYYESHLYKDATPERDPNPHTIKKG